MCLVAVFCRIDLQSTSFVGHRGHHAHRTSVPAIIYFGDISKIVCTAATCTLFWSCKWNLKLLLKRSQETYCVIQLTSLWIIYSESMRSISYWVCVHMKTTAHKHNESELPFECHMLLYPIKPRIYHTKKVLRVFLITLCLNPTNSLRLIISAHYASCWDRYKKWIDGRIMLKRIVKK